MDYKILGSGGYGIVISPPLKTHKSKKKNYVSKIIQKKKKNYNNEFKISKKLKNIKNIKNHFCLIEDIKIIKQNEIPKNVIESRPGARFKKKNKDYISLLMPYCGNEILNKKYQLYLKNNNNFTIFISHLLQSLKYLKTKKIVLGDIKLENLLVKNNNPILIDYGGSKIINNIYKNIHELVISQGYRSPDYYLFSEAIYDEDNDILKSKITYKDINNTIKDLIHKDYISELVYDMTVGVSERYSIANKDNNDAKDEKESINNLKKYYRLYKNKEYTMNTIKNLKNNIYKFDIYSLGRVFEDLYKILNLNNSKILSLIKNMIEFNHEKRFDIDQCISFNLN